VGTAAAVTPVRRPQVRYPQAALHVEKGASGGSDRRRRPASSAALRAGEEKSMAESSDRDPTAEVFPLTCLNLVPESMVQISLSKKIYGKRSHWR
jgi:hypothetical protein